MEEVVDTFEVQYARDASPGLDRIELMIALAGGVTSVLTVLGWDLALSVGWVAGWLLGQANVALLRRMMVRVLGGNLGSKVGLAMLVLKMLLLMGAVWWLLSALPVSPIGFAGGFTMTIAGLVVGSVIVASRNRGHDSRPDTTEVDSVPVGGVSPGQDERDGSDHAARISWSPV